LRTFTNVRYNIGMEVSITQFRRDLFKLVDAALDGSEVWVAHKGRRVRIAPDAAPASKLARLTPMEIFNPGSSELDEQAWKQDMQKAWEEDWADSAEPDVVL